MYARIIRAHVPPENFDQALQRPGTTTCP